MQHATGQYDVRSSVAILTFGTQAKEWTRERVPLQWATTQNNLGIALRILGESGTARLYFTIG